MLSFTESSPFCTSSMACLFPSRTYCLAPLIALTQLVTLMESLRRLIDLSMTGIIKLAHRILHTVWYTGV